MPAITAAKMGFPKGFDWGLYPEAERFLQKKVRGFLEHNSLAGKIAVRIGEQTSTRFFDWIDHIALPSTSANRETLKKLGFTELKDREVPSGAKAYRQLHTVLFPVLLRSGSATEIALKPENLSDFLKKNCPEKAKECGAKLFLPYQKVQLSGEKNFILSAVERRGHAGFVPKRLAKDAKPYSRALRAFLKRKRKFASDRKGMIETKKLVAGILKNLGSARAADAFFRAERVYWQSRNTAGKVQKKRQDALGLGWGNHDHHTYRSSRENFAMLIKIFESMGFVCREAFHAGEQAGWGAQILEHPECDVVVFADLDLSEKEKRLDFSHKKLLHRKKMGTVGFWIALHGESVLQAGMHHLECRFNFGHLKKDLLKHRVGVMQPFSDFDFLKQAFTVGETWRVEKKRGVKLLKEKSLSKEQFERFVKHGAIGSHMENLQRSQGFKGFNQKSVTAIIKATDPRKHVVKAA